VEERGMGQGEEDGGDGKGKKMEGEREEMGRMREEMGKGRLGKCGTWFKCPFFSFLFPILQKDEVYLNLVLDYVPETVYRVVRHHSKAKQIMPILYTKVHPLGAWKGSMKGLSIPRPEHG
jgi:hypothetical protein